MEEKATPAKPGRKLPWQDLVQDPSDLPHKEVEATVRLEVKCETQERAENVKCSFTWFNAEGFLQDAVAAGPISAWERDASAAPAAADGDGAAEEPPADAQVQAWFEKEATVKATIDFARRLATQQLSVSVTFPDPSWVPPVADVPKTPAKTPEKPAAGKKGKSAKEDAKKNSGTKETLNSAPKAEAPEKTVDVVVPLAPFLIDARNGASPSVEEEGVVVVLACPGILVFKVHVRFSENLLSDEIKLHLNPMLLTLNAVRKLPDEEHKGQRRHSVYAVLDAFGERRVADPRALDAKGGANFQFHCVFFVGPWNQEHFREFLQTAQFALEVRDRDGLVDEEKLRSAELQRALTGSQRPSLQKSSAPDLTASATLGSKPATANPKGKAAPKSSGGKLAPAAGPAPTSPTPEPPKPAPEAEGGASQRPPMPTHGLATFSLRELLNPRHHAALALRPSVVHVCREKKQRAGGIFAGPLDADVLFQRGTMEMLASSGGSVNDPGAGYLACGTYASITVSLALPLLHVKKVQAAKKAEEKERLLKEREERELQRQLQQQQQQQQQQASRPATNPKAGAARPKSKAMSRNAAAAEEPVEAAPPSAIEPEVVEEEPLDPRHERFGRLVLVVDYKKTTLVKRLIALVAELNVQALALDPSEAVALPTTRLTDAQKADFNLDIITGFVLIDRGHRIVVVEGLRLGAMQRMSEELGRGSIKPTKRCKMLYHEGVGFSRRLYGDFNLVLRQVKLRQRTLESLLCRPTLYDRHRRGDEAINTLHSLFEIKKAERMSALKSGDLFPEASGIVAVETQYGAFVSDEELRGGRVRHDDDLSATQGRSSPTGSDVARSERQGKDIEVTSKPRDSGSTHHSAKVGAAAALAEEAEGSDDSDSEREEAGLPRNPRITLKAPLDATNAAFVQTLKQRASQPAPSMNERHAEALRQRSEENAKYNAVTRKPPDATFLEGKPVHIYSGQALNTAELQKKALREKMAGKEGQYLWTYASDHNSGNFPMLEKDIPLSELLRQPDKAKMSSDPREPWRLPQPRDPAEYRKLPNDVSEGRKDDLRSAWIENQLYPELEHPKVVKGAFDAKNLGTGGAHVIPERRPGLQEPFAPPPAPPEASRPPMAFMSGCGATQMQSMGDKYKRGLLDGPPQSRGLRFEVRRVPRDLARTYGRGPAPHSLEVPPVSFNAQEEFREHSSTSQHLHEYMASVSRPLAAPGAFAATGVHTLRINPPSPSKTRTLKATGNTQPPKSARQASSRPPRAVATLSLSAPLSAR